MWSYFSRDSLANFTFEFLEEDSYLSDKTLWKVFSGKKKTPPYEKVSLFYYELKNANPEKADQMKTCFRSFKTLRHPNLLAFTDGIEAPDKICVVTEPVVSLSKYAMEREVTVEEITLGLHQICTALDFIIQRCNMIHNNVNWHSVFVTKSGEWKLGGFEFLTKKESESFPSKPSALQIYEPPERQRSGSNKRAPFATDSWGLGCLLWELYNGPLPRAQSVKQPGKVHEILKSIFSSLVAVNPSARLAPWQVIEQGSHPGGCMNNFLVKSNIFLDEIQIKNLEEKRYFFQSLHEKLETLPTAYATHKLLPILLDTVNNNVQFGSIILPSLMKIGENLESLEYEAQVVPIVVKLFSSPDRQTRISLLTKIDCYIEHVKSSTINNDIYPFIVQGFMDTNPTVREQTVKSMLFVAPKLSNKNLNDDLMRHFARIQAKDEQAGIRTNTTVCIGKLAGYMEPMTRQKVLPAACGKAMRDPFPPSRIAGILAMTANLKYFTVKDIASKCLPTICPLTFDPEKTVREQAFKAVNLMVKRLEEVHQNPEKVAEFEADVNRTVSHSSNKDIFKSFTGWVLSSWQGSGPAESTSDNLTVKSTSGPNSSRLNAANSGDHQRMNKDNNSSSDRLNTLNSTVTRNESRMEERGRDLKKGAIGLQTIESVNDSESKDGWSDEDLDYEPEYFNDKSSSSNGLHVPKTVNASTPVSTNTIKYVQDTFWAFCPWHLSFVEFSSKKWFVQHFKYFYFMFP